MEDLNTIRVELTNDNLDLLLQNEKQSDIDNLMSYIGPKDENDLFIGYQKEKPILRTGEVYNKAKVQEENLDLI